MKCDNCERDAIYTVDPKIANAVNYCGMHIPEYLKTAAAAGAFPLVDTSAPVDTKKSKKSAPADEPVPAEDPASTDGQ